ncbi:hypothetical protein [Flagellimonas eckloniae]|uniref:Uncharacterized protein n=1 Tax=Flagellimonas eckloniae TaxID=346185 RepID=A0A0Q1HBH1_9FLAO|nr:hypothetical protein [Allomuricauda eckloniae]KQC30878.1 hypothetical protein AAY42_14010 [Allomuricauda eckloniae]
MKKTILLITLISGLNIITAQNFIPEPGCPPIAWCNNDDIISSDNDMMDRFVYAADETGKDMNRAAEESGCDDSWNPSCIFADWFPCGYAEGSAQYTLCGKGNEPKPPTGDKPPSEDNPPAGDAPPTDDKPDGGEATTEVLKLSSSGFTAERLFKFYNKTKRGAVVHKYPNGYKLQLASKFQNKESKGLNYVLVFKIVDNRNRILANPVVYVTRPKNKNSYFLLKSDAKILQKK